MNEDKFAELQRKLREKAEAIVRGEVRIREKISQLAAEASQEGHRQARGLVALAEAVIEGAAQGLDSALPDKTESVLRQVIEGLGDGFATAAQAAQLTVEEASQAGAQFAREDLDKIGQDFRALGEMFVETAGRAGSALRQQVASQSQTLRDHARATLQRVKPALDSAAGAAVNDPVRLGKEALKAGAAASRRAAGTLFMEMARRLDSAGQKLTQDRPS